MIPRALRVAATLALLWGLGACHKDGDAVLLVVVTASGSPPAITALDVTLTGPAGSDSAHYARDGQQVIAFPTTLTAIVPPRATGTLAIDVRANDAAGNAVATGHEGPLVVRAGTRQTIYVQLECSGNVCATDGGTGQGGDGGTSSGDPRCGNGTVDPTETCDTAIPAGDPGACPPLRCQGGVCRRCDDRISCTRDRVVGADCTTACVHEEIVSAVPGDECCPVGATFAEDADCSPTCGNGTVDPGETCDTAIAAGAPGACPTEPDCKSGDACSKDSLISARTCSAVCLHEPLQAASGPTDGGVPAPTDGGRCCLPGSGQTSGNDCPSVCGDGIKAPDEKCDPGIPSGAMGSCPGNCIDDDPNPKCHPGFITGTGCQASCVYQHITARVSGDGCCPAGATRATDTDCPTQCGNGRLEPGEACDKTATGFGACPTTCPLSPSACLHVTLIGSSDDCSARCVTSVVSACSLQKDGCCPTGCTFDNDADCSQACGDELLQPTQGEVCDTKIRAGRPGACPTSCGGNGCTEARLMSAGTCAATCVLLPITAPRAGDGCCPNGADFTVDTDCPALCGNGIVESPAERCDYAAGEGACPTSCPAAGACARVELRGADKPCSSVCVTQPITGCAAGDGCCPAGCTMLTDSDCPVICGNAAVEPGESCDRGITAGAPGACPRSCNDADACTVDLADGTVESCSRTCRHVRITACLGGDGCCPAGCTAATDGDCNATCGDSRVGAGETCDPPTTCPTTCPDDGDRCTLDRLVGTPQTCDAACRHLPITTCSGARSDGCCPTGCTSTTDSDC